MFFINILHCKTFLNDHDRTNRETYWTDLDEILQNILQKLKLCW